jgi:hypothetical protein
MLPTAYHRKAVEKQPFPESRALVTRREKVASGSQFTDKTLTTRSSCTVARIR